MLESSNGPRWAEIKDTSGAVTGRDSVEVLPYCVHEETILALTTIWHP